MSNKLRLEQQRIYEPTRTLGRYRYGDDFWCSLELPDKDNQTDESCIPHGLYECEKYYSEKYGRTCIRILNVVGRSSISIHPANYISELKGCQAAGMSFQDIDGDGKIDVASSNKALDEMLAVLPDKFELLIKN